MYVCREDLQSPKTPENLRICYHCNLNLVEDEMHFSFDYMMILETLCNNINERNRAPDETDYLQILAIMKKCYFYLIILIHILAG